MNKKRYNAKSMRILISFLTVAFSVSVLACGQQTQSPPAADPATGVFPAIGLVTKFNEESGEVAIDHDEIKGLMPAMEMDFELPADSAIDKESIGTMVNFELAKTDDGYKIATIASASGISPKEKYLINCARCHGEFGEGRLKGIPLTEGHALAHTEEDFIKTVTNGKKKMPAFRSDFSDDEIKWIVRYVRKVIQQGKVASDKHVH